MARNKRQIEPLVIQFIKQASELDQLYRAEKQAAEALIPEVMQILKKNNLVSTEKVAHELLQTHEGTLKLLRDLASNVQSLGRPVFSKTATDEDGDLDSFLRETLG